MTISNRMTVIALVNGMIGGIILVMPVMGLNTGYMLIAPLTIILGFFSYFSCLLCLRHLKNYNDLDEAVLKHFGNNRKYKVFYDIIIVVSMTVLLILYFNLICEQWESMTTKSRLIPILNAVVLFPIVYIMKKFDFGASLLGYGILSIVGYCIFLIWMWATAPQGQKKVQPASPLFVQLAAALAQGFAIQTFFIPVLKKNINKHLYKRLLGVTYVAGVVVYTYIGYVGAFSIVNRQPLKKQPQTIEDFFGDKEWQVITLEIIYLIHLYSAFPQFLLVAKKRFFSIANIQQSDDVTINETIYVSVTILLGLIIKLTNISVDVIIEINGGVISFFFIYVIPISLHIKCVYFSKNKHVKMIDEAIQKEMDIQYQKSSEKQIESNKKPQKVSKKLRNIQLQQSKSHQKEMKNLQANNMKNFDIQENPIQIQPQQIEMKKQQVMNSQNQFNKNNGDQKSIMDKIQMIKSTIIGQSKAIHKGQQQQCQCDVQFSSKFQQIGEMIAMVTMVLCGVFVMGYTLYTLANPQIGQQI